MKILVLGSTIESVQRVLQLLEIQKIVNEISGVCLEHTFETKYFKQQVGVWIDDIKDIDEWVSNFISTEAKQVRDVLMMVIICLDNVTTSQLKEFKKFTDLLSKEHSSALVVGSSPKELSNEQISDCENANIDILYDDLLAETHLCIADWQEPPKQEESEEPFENVQELMEPLVDLNEIIGTLREARISDMTDKEKQKLASDLARRLVP